MPTIIVDDPAQCLIRYLRDSRWAGLNPHEYLGLWHEHATFRVSVLPHEQAALAMAREQVGKGPVTLLLRLGLIQMWIDGRVTELVGAPPETSFIVNGIISAVTWQQHRV